MPGTAGLVEMLLLTGRAIVFLDGLDPRLTWYTTPSTSTPAAFTTATAGKPQPMDG